MARPARRRRLLAGFVLLLLAMAPHMAVASPPGGPAVQTGTEEDGHDLWLRYRPLAAARAQAVRPQAQGIVVEGPPTPVTDAARRELLNGLSSLLGAPVATLQSARPGAIILRRNDQSTSQIAGLGTQGYAIQPLAMAGGMATVITANSDTGLLYGSFALLRHVQLGGTLHDFTETAAPKLKIRVLDHWDNLDRSVERGYAGQSIWDWWRLPDQPDARLTDYARANASIGINGAVLNNVNAVAQSLTAPYLAKAAAIADVLRPYGMKVYLSARFSAPIELGHLKTADPLDPAVQAWWNAKADEIYALIPDFGGFLVKANSEGQPGPGDYGRTHADGANMLATALRPHGGIVMWRAFVYSERDASDRAMQAYAQLQPLDGKFAANVLLQVKNGPIDFQPREPFHPLFGAMPRTQVMMEVQITKEYLGFANSVAYLGTMWQEVLQADTCRPHCGTTVAQGLEHPDQPTALTGIAGVANIGTDRNWTGSDFDQANWYAYGRLAWNPDLGADRIAREWLAQTFSADPHFIAPAQRLMMMSRQAVVEYMTPLGLAHQMATGHHYGPAPWVSDLARPEWNPTYYARADHTGIGFDRTATGSNALAQYAPELARQWGNKQTVPLDLLLWFHRCGWDEKLRDGRTTWQDLIGRYDQGMADVDTMRHLWLSIEPYVDDRRFARIDAVLAVQQHDARWWRDASLAYYLAISGKALPDGVRTPDRSLSDYKAIQLEFVPGITK